MLLPQSEILGEGRGVVQERFRGGQKISQLQTKEFWIFKKMVQPSIFGMIT